jgi:hypothetical protein
MLRAYITGWQDRESEGMRTPVEVTFSFKPEEAFSWPSRESAQLACPIFDSYRVVVSWAKGGEYVCKDFRVEERSPREFLIFCDGPFTFKATGSKALLEESP